MNILVLPRGTLAPRKPQSRSSGFPPPRPPLLVGPSPPRPLAKINVKYRPKASYVFARCTIPAADAIAIGRSRRSPETEPDERGLGVSLLIFKGISRAPGMPPTSRKSAFG